jgi:hypothetical protein
MRASLATIARGKRASLTAVFRLASDRREVAPRLNGRREAASIKGPVSSVGTDGAMDEIERLEFRIEEIGEAIKRSRRLRLAGRASAALGPLLIAGFALGIVDYSPTRMIAALALAIGGIVLMGSSRSSTEELERALKQAEAERIAAIDALNLIQVGEGPSNHH